MRQFLAMTVGAALVLTLSGFTPTVAADPLPGDVDGDGFADLVVGRPLDTLKAKGRTGSFGVLFGDASGVSVHDQRWHRDRRGVKSVAVGTFNEEEACCLGRFGGRVTTGDFDGDGYSDVAATAAANPRTRKYPRQNAGVNVLYGSSVELSADGDQVWTLSSRGVKGRDTNQQSLAGIMVSGDFNGDGRDDLVVSGGKIQVIPGARGGLTSRGDVRFGPAAPALDGPGKFVGPVAVGDFNGDGRDDLVVARNHEFSGAISVLYGGADLINPRRNRYFNLDSPGMPGEVRVGDTFGTALAAGDFNGDGFDELAAGASYYNYSAQGDPPSGRVFVLPGSQSGLTSEGAQELSRVDPGMPSNTTNGRFGENLAAGDIDADQRDDLVVYDAAERRTEEPATQQGALHVLFGSPNGVTTAQNQLFTASDLPEAGRLQFVSLTMADYNGDGHLDLTFGTGQLVSVLLGGAQGLDAETHRVYSGATPGIKGPGALESLVSGNRF